MRRGYSPIKTRLAPEIDYNYTKFQGEKNNRNVKDWKNFCHYNNAVYMGGMNASQKHGKGLLLHDNGASVITEYNHDSPSGHNIIFRQNSITSIFFNTELQYDIAYKTGKYIIKIPFIDASYKASGLGFLIDYQQSKLYELIFQNGAIVEKILHLNRKNNEDAFKRNTITKTIGVKHEQAFQLTFQKPDNMHVKYDQNQLIIGYYNTNGDLHGLGFKAYAENAQVSGLKSLYLKSIQRGYYKNGNLQTFGQKFFSNGNKYVGQFQQGQYSGQGILLCPQQMKWVYGNFVNGKLNEVIDSNNEKHTRNDYEVWIDSLWQIHKRYRQRWIDLNIELPDELYLYHILKDAAEMKQTGINPDQQAAQRQDFQNLNKIQQQFQQGYPGDRQRSYVDQQLDRHYFNRSGRKSNQIPNNQRTRNDYKQRPKIDYPQRDYIPSKDITITDFNQIRPYKLKYNDPYEYPNYRRYYDNLDSRYKDRQPIEGIYRPLYLQQSYKQRDRLKKLEQTDKQYLRNLRDDLAKSPVHRNYYDYPTRYSPPDRYTGRIQNRKYYDPIDFRDRYQRRPQSPLSKTPLYYQNQPLKNSRQQLIRPSRNSPYKRQKSPNNRYIQNNYKYWN